MSTRVVYARVSTEEQAERGFSLQSQDEACRRRADELGGGHVIVFSDAMSGEHLSRPGLDALREYVREHKPSHVICLDPDRLSRKVAHQLLITEEIQKHSEIVFIQHDYKNNPEGHLFYTMRGAIAEYEKEKIRERTSRGRREKLRNGKLPFHVVIYGYDWDSPTANLTVNEEQARWVRQIFAWAGDRMTVAEIVGKMNELGVPTKKNTRWYTSTIRRILANTTYKGELRGNRHNCSGASLQMQLPKVKRTAPITHTIRPEAEWITVAVPPIVDEVTWRRAQGLGRPDRRSSSHALLMLSGLLSCGLCGGAVHYIPNESNGYVLRCIHRYSKSRESKRALPTCKLPHVKAAIIEEQVWAEITSWLTDPATLLRKLRSSNTSDSTALAERAKEELLAVRTLLDGKRREQDIVISHQLSGVLDGVVATRRLSSLKDEIDRLTTEVSSLNERVTELMQSRYDFVSAERNLARMTKSLGDAVVAKLGELTDGRRGITRALVRSVVLMPGRMCTTHPLVPLMSSDSDT
jgi:site-specific DNA recombinase